MDNNHFFTLRKKITLLGAITTPYGAYFKGAISFLNTVFEQYDFVTSGEIYNADITELRKRNKNLYTGILPENYAGSYADPAFSVKSYGDDFGKLFSFLSAELHSLITYAHEKRPDQMVIRLELFMKIFEAFDSAEKVERKTPVYEDIVKILRDYVTENLEFAALEKMVNQFTTKNDFANRIIMESDLTDLRYLYYFGEYITENELEVAAHLNSLPVEKIKLMADTFTEGYRIGFEVMGKDIKKKKTVSIHYGLGFERVIRQAVDNFAVMGLNSIFSRMTPSVLDGRSIIRTGYTGAYANKQYDFDHKDDNALILDQNLADFRLSVMEKAFLKIKTEVNDFAGPARLEVFGEVPPTPAYKNEAIRPSSEQQKLMVEYMKKAGDITNRFIPREEISYTIMALPTPEIGSRFAEIFDETIALNTLDYHLYRKVQQAIIDTLDQAEYVQITGCGANKTNLIVAMNELADPARQTNFENCVADVNIPVGEVFTSPKLKGTNGTLHVTRVFLDNLEYQDLIIEVKDGMVTDYDCANFAAKEENQKFIKENVLFHHDSLPVSEFAIGTNTTAYMVGKKYDIADRFPILIAEKTGPHFAFGDTCYAKSEDVAVFNPDGKEIVARDNEITLMRKTDKSKAYFNCHTDITIPYDELGEIIVKTKSGAEVPIFSGGQFVLPGCEELNKW